MRIEQFQIPLWNLKREQHISMHASAWYPKCQYPKRPERPENTRKGAVALQGLLRTDRTSIVCLHGETL